MRLCYWLCFIYLENCLAHLNPHLSGLIQCLPRFFRSSGPWGSPLHFHIVWPLLGNNSDFIPTFYGGNTCHTHCLNSTIIPLCSCLLFKTYIKKKEKEKGIELYKPPLVFWGSMAEKKEHCLTCRGLCSWLSSVVDCVVNTGPLNPIYFQFTISPLGIIVSSFLIFWCSVDNREYSYRKV